MAGKLQQEIGQSRPFSSLEEEALLNIHRTADVLEIRLTELLKPYGLTGRQYNVLRILRGAGESGASCKQIAARMVSADPDVTRLIDRMETRHLVTRGRSNGDRRIVAIQIAPAGLELLSALDPSVQGLAQESMKGLDGDALRTLIDLLERLRG